MLNGASALGILTGSSGTSARADVPELPVKIPSADAPFSIYCLRFCRLPTTCFAGHANVGPVHFEPQP